MKQCSKCSTMNAENAQFCCNCGASLNATKSNFCSQCGNPIEEKHAFCPKCGNAIGQEPKSRYETQKRTTHQEPKSVGFIEAILTCLGDKFFELKGRATRSEYWYYALFLSIMMLFLIPLCLFLDAEFLWIPAGLLVFFIIPMIPVSVRRLHDIGESGWWYFLNFIPGIGTILFIMLVLNKSQKGANEYGPFPK